MKTTLLIVPLISALTVAGLSPARAGNCQISPAGAAAIGAAAGFVLGAAVASTQCSPPVYTTTYVAPAPVCAAPAPAPMVVMPAPIVAPAPVYYVPAPVYVVPPVYVAAPVWVAPRPVYYAPVARNWGPRVGFAVNVNVRGGHYH